MRGLPHAVTRLYLGFWTFPCTLPPAAAVFPRLQELGLGSIAIGEQDLAFLVKRRKEVEGEDDVWAPHVSELNGEKQ